MTPEGKVKKKVKDILKATTGCWFFMPATYGFGRSGVPDIIGCYCGRFFAIECKANGNKPTALQEKAMRDIQAGGGVAWLVDDSNLAEFQIFFAKWCANAKKELTNA
jgi:hypothetical protein